MKQTRIKQSQESRNEAIKRALFVLLHKEDKDEQEYDVNLFYSQGVSMQQLEEIAPQIGFMVMIVDGRDGNLVARFRKN